MRTQGMLAGLARLASLLFLILKKNIFYINEFRFLKNALCQLCQVAKLKSATTLTKNFSNY